jgi:hypothetical protein
MSIHRSHQKEKDPTATAVEEPLIDTGITIADNTDGLDEVDINDISESSQSESDTDSDSDQEKKEFKLAKQSKKKDKNRSYSIDLGDTSDNSKKIKGRITTNENDE